MAATDTGTLDIQELLKAVLEGNSAPLKEALTNQETASQAITGLVGAAAEPAIRLTEAQQAQKVEEGKAIQQNAKILGTDATDPNSRINITSQMLSDSIDHAQQDIRSIEAIHSIDFFKHPVDFITGHLALIGEEGDLYRHTKEATLLSNQINQLNASTQSTAETQGKIHNVTTASMARDHAQLTAIDAEIKYQTAAKDAFGVSADTITKLNTASYEQLRLALTLDNANFNRSQQGLIDEQRRALIDARNRAKEDETAALADYNAGRAQYGLPASSAAHMRIDKKNAEFFITAGQQASVGASPLGNDIGETVANLTQYKNGLKGPVPSLVNQVSDMAAASISQTGAKVTPDTLGLEAGKIFNGDGKAAGLTDLMRTNAATPFITFKGKRFTNIYTIPDIPTVLSVNKGALDTAFGKEILQPALASPNPAARNSDPMQLADAAAAAMITKNLSVDDVARGMAQFYTTGVAYNNKVGGQYAKYNLPPLSGYVENGVDWTNEAQIKTYLVKRAVWMHIRAAGVPKMDIGYNIFSHVAGSIEDKITAHRKELAGFRPGKDYYYTDATGEKHVGTFAGSQGEDQ